MSGFDSNVVIYEEITVDNVRFVAEDKAFYYPCPCGDEFVFYLVCTVILLIHYPQEDLQEGLCISTCPSCSLNIRLNLKFVRYLSFVYVVITQEELQYYLDISNLS